MSDTKQSPEAYSGFETQPIGGRWRAGRSVRSLTDTDPFNGKTLAEIRILRALIRSDKAIFHESSVDKEHEMSSSMTSQGVRWTFVACAALSFALLSVFAFAKNDVKWKSGEDVYAKVCAYCHEAGVGPVIKGRRLTPAYVSTWVRHGWGAMPSFTASFIDDKALQDLADYVSQSAVPQK